MKKKLKMILTPLLLVALVGCGPKPTTTSGGGTTPNPTTPPPGPVSTVVPGPTTSGGGGTTVPTPSTTVPTPTTNPTPSTPLPNPDDYYNPTHTGYHVPKNVANMHAAYVDAAADTESGFAGKIVALQQYTSSSANVFFSNGSYGFRINNVPAESLAVGQEYVVTAGKHTSSTYNALNYNNTNVTPVLTPLNAGTISVSDVDLDNVAKVNEGSYLSFTGATVSEIITGKYAGLKISYKDKEYSLTFPSNVTTAPALQALVDSATVGSTLSGKVVSTGFASNQYTLISASDLTLDVLQLEKYLTVSGPTIDGITTTVTNSIVTIGQTGETLPLDAENKNTVSIEATLPAEVASWSQVTSVKVDGVEVTLPSEAAPLTIDLDYTEVNTHTVAVDFADSRIKDYSFTVELGEEVIKAVPAAALNGVVSINTAVGTNLELNEDKTKIASGEVAFVSEAEISLSTINGFNYGRGYYIVLDVTAPEGAASDQIQIKRAGESDYQSVSGYTFEANVVSIPFYIERDAQSPTIAVSIIWKTGVTAQEISLGIDENVTYATWADEVVANGVIAPDQNSDINGKPTGSIDAEHPITTSVENKTITFGGAEEQIAYYPEDKELGRSAGNRVGITISAPTNVNDVSEAVVTIYRNGNIHKENLKWNESIEADGKLYWYPEVTQDMLNPTEDVVISTVEIDWGPDVAHDVYTIKVKAGTTLQPNLAAPYLELKLYEGTVSSSSPSSSTTANAILTSWKALLPDNESAKLVNIELPGGTLAYKGNSLTDTLVKFGSGSKKDNSITITLNEAVTRVTFSVVPWSGKTVEFSVNGGTTQSKTGTGYGAVEECAVSITFDIESTTSFTLRGNLERFFLVAMSFEK